jgi:hypothetical protein
VYLQLMLERQLLAAAFFQQWQQQQQQQGQGQVNAEGRLRELSVWKELLKKSNSVLLELTKLTAATQGGASCLTQLLSGPDAPLPRALAVPLHVEGFWDAAVQQDVSSSPGEQLYALKAALEAATGGDAPGEQVDNAQPLLQSNDLASLKCILGAGSKVWCAVLKCYCSASSCRWVQLLTQGPTTRQVTLNANVLLHHIVCPCVCTQRSALTAYHAQLSLTAACAPATLRQQTCRQLRSCWQTSATALICLT